MKKSLLLESVKDILDTIEDGIHIIDRDGVTIVYNQAMEEIEGISAHEIMGKGLLEIYPNWSVEKSTLLTAVGKGEKIEQQRQSYLNHKGQKVSTVNTTFPIFEEGKIIGAVEIARNYTEVSHLSEQVIDLQQQLIKPKTPKSSEKQHYTFDNIIGKSKQLLDAIKIARRATETNSSVLIQGDTGTGKELFAQSIHYASSRHNRPFIAQNCAAIPDALLESILFGTAKGSFTGALDRPGLFEQAAGGTLFLDEINSMSIQLQAKLLRVLQENYVRRVGGLKDLQVNVRIIAATNEDPKKLMEKKLFRKDLFYRLNVINIRIPGLQDRQEDIPLLTSYFINMYNQRLNKNVKSLSKELQDAFSHYQWVGNARELQNLIESAMNMITNEEVISLEHLPAHFEDQAVLTEAEPYKVTNYFQNEGLVHYMEKIEREIILQTLEKYHFNISETATELKISRQNLQYKIKKYHLTF
ncbi:MAG: sigma 54-interacting transcriptional regulator [Spirochaetes bacterium]|nr:sigma 54-interacting transcriptional regulator [Spirochaetota bacterium]